MKKLLALSLAVVMLFALAACGTGGASSSQSQPSQSAQVEPTQAPGSNEPSDEPEIQEFPLVTEPAELRIWTYMQPALANNGLMDSWSQHTVFKEMEKLTGVHIDFTEVALGAKAEQFAIVCSGGDLPDMFKECGQLYKGGSASAVNDEIIINLDEYLDLAPHYTALLDSDPTYWPQARNIDGHVAEFFSYTTEGLGLLTNGTMIRQDWLDAQSLETPETYDELLEVLKVFKTEYGCTSAFAINSAAPYGDINSGFGLGYFYWNLDNRTENTSYLRNYDGKVGLTITDAAYKDFLTLLNTMYSEGLIDQDFMSIQGGDNSADMLQMIGSQAAGVFQLQLSDIATVKESCEDKNMAFSAVAPFTVNKGDQVYTKEVSAIGVNNAMSVTTACQDPELAVRWMDAWYSDEGFLIANYGEKDVTYTLNADGEPEFTDLVLNNPDGIPVALACIMYTAMNPMGAEWLGAKRADVVRLAVTYPQEQLDMIYTWVSNRSDTETYVMPAVSLTADDAAEFSLLWGDISTYARENILKFITGEKPLSEYDEYLDEMLNVVGGNEALEIYQKALDEYLAK